MQHRAIYVLPPIVVERIAAGEVIDRSSAALKEILENSIDAGADQVEILFHRDGGFQIRDNGHGIRDEDLSILCRRHTTSKLRSVEDLKAMETLGFRGEALSSVSNVARLTVTTRTNTAPYAMRVVYGDGAVLKSPTPCSGLHGTTIAVDRFFHNDPIRFRRHKPGEELTQGIDIIRCYAAHCIDVEFSVKREGRHDLELMVKRTDAQLERFAAVYGCNVVQNLIPLGKHLQTNATSNKTQYEFNGWISNSSYESNNSLFLVFVNNRCVQCLALKRAVMAIYTYLLPKTVSFVYIHLRIPLSHVDVNVHPTKREVAFLFQNEIIQSVAKTVQERLKYSVHSQSVKAAPKVDIKRWNEELNTHQTIQSFMDEKENHSQTDQSTTEHNSAMTIIKEGIYAGRAGNIYVFMHFGDGLYLLDMEALSNEFFIRVISQRAGNFEAIRLDNPVKTHASSRLARKLKSEMALSSDELSTTNSCAKCRVIREAFGVEISSDGSLLSLPCLLEGYPPNLNNLESFLHCVLDWLLQWDGNMTRTTTLIEAIAKLFSLSDLDWRIRRNTSGDIIEAILLPAMREHYHPSSRIIHERRIIRVTTIEQLCARCGR